MLEKLIKSLVVIAIGYVVYLVVSAIIAAFALPSLIAVIAAAIIVLAVCVYILRIFGINTSSF